jgi:enoyl-CoA hydratase/carnithine racemase
VRAGVYGAGVSLLSACPVVLATGNASLHLPEAKRGIFPVGVVPYMEAQIPRRRLLSIGMEGGSISAAEALQYGLITEVVPDEQLEARSRSWAELAVSQPEVAKQAKRWWSEPILDDGFQRRVAGLEAMLSGHLPPTAPTAPAAAAQAEI